MSEGGIKIDEFEYKGRNISVKKEEEGEITFSFIDDGKEVFLSIREIREFIEGPYSHTTINNNAVDMIEKSVKINNLLFNLKDLKSKIKKYSNS